MGIFGGMGISPFKAIGQMFDGKPGSAIEDRLRKNGLHGSRPASHDGMAKDFAPGGAPQVPTVQGAPKVPLPTEQDDTLRRALMMAPQLFGQGSPPPGPGFQPMPTGPSPAYAQMLGQLQAHRVGPYGGGSPMNGGGLQMPPWLRGRF